MLVNETYYTGESIPAVIRIQFHRIQYFSIWSPGFLLSSPGFSNASPSTSPGFSQVRVFFGSESESESESGPGFEVCRPQASNKLFKHVQMVYMFANLISGQLTPQVVSRKIRVRL